MLAVPAADHLRHFASAPGLPPAGVGGGFSQMVTGTGRLVVISGQVAINEHGQLVGEGDPVAQARQVYQNIGHCLAAARATYADVVKFTHYLTDISFLPQIREVRKEFVDPERSPTSTLVQVAALASPGFLLEVEAWAVVAEAR